MLGSFFFPMNKLGWKLKRDIKITKVVCKKIELYSHGQARDQHEPISRCACVWYYTFSWVSYFDKISFSWIDLWLTGHVYISCYPHTREDGFRGAGVEVGQLPPLNTRKSCNYTVQNLLIFIIFLKKIRIIIPSPWISHNIYSIFWSFAPTSNQFSGAISACTPFLLL